MFLNNLNPEGGKKSYRAQLNCRVGDLAITVRFNQLENVGIIIQIVGVCMYLDEREGFENPIHIWDVDAVCKDSHIA